MLLTLFFIFSITTVSSFDTDLSYNNINTSASKDIDILGFFDDLMHKDFNSLISNGTEPDRKYGYWVWSGDMHSVNFDELSNNGVNVIFLNSYAFTEYGQREVLEWIKDANNHGIEVHIWMQIFYTGDWTPPVINGNPNTQYFNQKIDEARYYAGLEGVSGLQMDYIRFDGDAYRFQNGTYAINEFVKNFTHAVKEVNPSLTVSATVMPETDNDIYYYGQDIPTMGKYVDVIIPMMYKGNYEENSSWIHNTTQWFVENSGDAEVWVGLQTYQSDDNVTNTPASELIKDGQLCFGGGAEGVVYFKWGMNEELDHRKLN